MSRTIVTNTHHVTAPAAAAEVYPLHSQENYIQSVDRRLDRILDNLNHQWLTHTATHQSEALATIDIPSFLRERLAGGKRLRPLCSYWGCVAGSNDLTDYWDCLIELGAALEMLHVFGLIQDDVMDSATTRRGIPTIHVIAANYHRANLADGDPQRFAESIAILASDVAHALAHQQAAMLPVPAQQLWHHMVMELVAGQTLDIIGGAEQRRDMDHAQYLAWLKSGAYTVARPMQLGAALTHPNAELMRALHTYGHHVGLAFALRDDLLGVWGDPALTGKPVGDDLIQGKATALVALADKMLTGNARELLGRAFHQQLSNEDIPELQQALERAGVKERVEDMIDRHVREGLAALERTTLSDTSHHGLTDLACTIAWRNK